MKKVLSFFVLSFCLMSGGLVFAGDEQDVAKLPCKEFISNTNEMPMMLAWIDGYMSAKSDNTVMSSAWMEKLGKHMGEFCSKNPNKTIMEAMEALPAE